VTKHLDLLIGQSPFGPIVVVAEFVIVKIGRMVGFRLAWGLVMGRSHLWNRLPWEMCGVESHQLSDLLWLNHDGRGRCVPMTIGGCEGQFFGKYFIRYSGVGNRKGQSWEEEAA
jgi:hypothetical protein